MEKMELSEALKANASVLEGLMPIANLGSEGLLRKGVLSPVLACNKGSVQEVCIVRIANSGNSYVGVILYIYIGVALQVCSLLIVILVTPIS